MKKILIIIILFISLQISYSQTSEEYFKIAYELFEENNYEYAIDNFEKAISKDEENKKSYEYYAFKGICNYSLGKISEAENDFNKSIELKSNYYLAYRYKSYLEGDKKNYKKEIELLDLAIKYNAKDVNSYMNRGASNFNLENYSNANEDYSKVIEINPKNADAYFSRGNLNYKLENYKEALIDFSKAIEFNNKFYEAYISKGNTNFALNKLNETIEEYSKALEINPNNADLFFIRGNLYFETNKLKESILDFSKSIELNPQNIKANAKKKLAEQKLKEMQMK